MYLCRTLTRASLAKIANAFRKNHATVIHACKIIQGRCQADLAVRDTAQELTHLFRASPETATASVVQYDTEYRDGMKHAIEKNERMRRMLESAARFQKLVPDAVLVGGSARIGHRGSFDYAHVLADLQSRFADIFELLSMQEAWQTAHVRDGKLILGSFDGVEAGLRQLRRHRPLETENVVLGNGDTVRVPTLPEMVRVKAFLVTNRNQTRDYLDLAALADREGIPFTASVLTGIDDYYEKALSSLGSVAAELLTLLARPAPADSAATRELAKYKQLDAKYTDWAFIVEICRDIAAEMLKGASPC
jgi:hypothetical protein